LNYDGVNGCDGFWLQLGLDNFTCAEYLEYFQTDHRYLLAGKKIVTSRQVHISNQILYRNFAEEKYYSQILF
jgi:hypothetical protein